MSKSLGNSFLPLELIAGSHPLLEKGYSPMVVKFFFLQANYRSTVDFSNEALQAAEKGYARMMTAIETLDEIMPSATTSFDIVAFINKTNESMNDDFNTPVTIANLFDGVKIINNIKSEKATITAKDLTKLKALYNNFIFDIFGLQKESSTAKNDYLDGIMNIVMNIRHEAKASKNWELSDLIRDELKKLNITIQDSKDGSNWTVEN